jgi:hypothetical protein
MKSIIWIKTILFKRKILKWNRMKKTIKIFKKIKNKKLNGMLFLSNHRFLFLLMLMRMINENQYLWIYLITFI